jgi:hypothetical protein
VNYKLSDKKYNERKRKVYKQHEKCIYLISTQAADVVIQLKSTLKSTITASLEKEKEILSCDTELGKLAEGMYD